MHKFLHERVRSKRLEKGWSQAELAEGICKQSQVSRIEKGDFSPGSDILFAISRKLDVPMDYFYDPEIPDDAKPIKHLGMFRIMVRELMDAHQYDRLAYLLAQEQAKYPQLSIADQQFMDWCQGVVLYEYEGDKEAAHQHLLGLSDQLTPQDPLYLDCLNTLANLYYAMGEIDQYLALYQRLAAETEALDLIHIYQLQTYIKVRANYVRFLSREGKIAELIVEATNLLKICQHYQVSYGVDDVLLNLANQGEHYLSREEREHYYRQAMALFQLNGRRDMYLQINQYLLENFSKE